MCTVTFIHVADKIFLTSNRDESSGRAAAIAPAIYIMQTGQILFPKDPVAGGTWFAVHENGNCFVLLNGAKEKHLSTPPYRKSRGLVLLDIADSHNPIENFADEDYSGIEPFTVVAWCNEKLFECRWDGSKKSTQRLIETVPHIWSSVTLYDKPVRTKRESWFREWVPEHPRPDQKDMLAFHQFTGDGDPNNDLLMNRSGALYTVSITSVEITKSSALLEYLDCKEETSAQVKFKLLKATSHTS